MATPEKSGTERLSEQSKSVAIGSFWSLFGSTVFKLVSFAYVVIVARLASQDDVGVFYLALSIATIVSFISEFGILGSLTRYVPFFEGSGEFRKVRDLLNFSYLSIIPAIILAAIMFFCSGIIGSAYHSDTLAYALQVFAVFVALNGAFKVVNSFLNGRADMKSSQLVSNVQNVSKLIFTVVLFCFYGPSLSMLCIAFALSFIPPLLISWRIMGKHLSQIPKTGDPLPTDQLIKEIIPFGFMLSLLGSFSIIVTSADRLFLGFLIPPTESSRLLALYSMAANLAFVINVFPGSIGAIFFPLISRLFGKGDTEGMRALMATSQRWMLFITLPIALILILFPSEILSIIYGSGYAAGSLVLSILSLAIVIQSFSYIIALVIAGARRVDIELEVMGICAIANLILTPLLIYLMGFAGAAVALAASFLFMTILYLHFAKKLFGFSIPSESYKLIFSAFIVAILIFLVKPQALMLLKLLPSFGAGELAAYSAKLIFLLFVAILVALSFALFFPIALLLKCFKKEDVLLMKSVLTKAMAPASVIEFAEKIADYGVGRQPLPKI